MPNNTTATLSDQVIPTSSAISRFPEKRRKLLIDDPGIDWWPDIKERLEHLLDLERGWDGYQGASVSFANANFALRVLEAICNSDTPAPQIVPGTEGDLQIEWHTDTVEIELHVIAPNNVQAWICNDETGKDGKELEFTNNFIEVVPTMEKMTEYSVDSVATA